MAKTGINAESLSRDLIREISRGVFRPVYLLMGDEPYYPVNNDDNNRLYEKYRVLAGQEKNILFGGRLGEYRYYDMDAVLLRALKLAEEELGD